MPPLPGTFTAGKSSSAMTSASKKDEFARFGVHLRQCFVCRFAGALEPDILRVDMPHRRFDEEFLLRRIEPLESEEDNVRLAHQRRFAPKTHRLRCALADDLGPHHSIDAAGGSPSRSI